MTDDHIFKNGDVVETRSIQQVRDAAGNITLVPGIYIKYIKCKYCECKYVDRDNYLDERKCLTGAEKLIKDIIE